MKIYQMRRSSGVCLVVGLVLRFQRTSNFQRMAWIKPYKFFSDPITDDNIFESVKQVTFFSLEAHWKRKTSTAIIL